MGKNAVIVAVLAVLLILGGGFYLMQMRNQDAPDTQFENRDTTPAVPSVSTSSDSASTGAEQSGVKEFTVTGSPFKFEPAQMSVNKGDKVKITFVNSNGMHNFVLDEFKVETKVLQAEQKETLEFTADKIGTFEYYCSVGNHKAMGMKGTFTVQ